MHGSVLQVSLSLGFIAELHLLLATVCPPDRAMHARVRVRCPLPQMALHPDQSTVVHR